MPKLQCLNDDLSLETGKLRPDQVEQGFQCHPGVWQDGGTDPKIVIKVASLNELDKILPFVIGEDIKNENAFKFGHCPNYLTPHPQIRQLGLELYQLLSYKCQMSNLYVKSELSDVDVGCQMSDVKCQRSKVKCQITSVRSSR